jgi:serine/threonine protein kinase
MVHVQRDLRGNKKERSAIEDKRDAILSKRRRICTGLLNPTNYQSILASPISTSKPSNRTVFSDEPSFAQEKNDITSLSPLTSDITYKTIESIEIEDIFTKLMDFFVTPSLIDVDSVSSILYVSKVWNDLSSRAVVWKNTQRAQIINRKRQIQNPLKLISDRLIGFRNLGQLKNSGTLTIHGQSFFVSERSTGRTYRLKVQRLEQSVGEEQRGGQQSRENCQDEDEWSSSKSVDSGADFECTVLPSSTFREIRAMEKLSAHHEVRTVQEGQRENQSHQLPCHVSTLKLWDIVHGYLLRWYDYTETTVTLSDYISEKQMLSSGDVKDIISKILLGVQDIHNCGLIHRNLTLETIWVSTLKHNEEVINGKSGVNSEMSIQIGDFEHCSNVVSADEPYTEVQNGHGISDTSGNLQPTSSLSSHTSTSLVFSGHQAPEIMITSNLLNGMPVDMWAIGCIFAKLLTLNKENQKNEPNWTMDVSKLLSLLTTSSNIREDQDGSKSGGYDEFFPESNFQIGREELHLLKRLICCNPSDRITASEALKHHLFDQSFSNYIITGKEVVLDRVRQYHKINSWKEAVSYSLDKVDKIERVHPRADQHAIIVDWLFEIVTVFEKDALTCFLAIDIMKLYCKNSSKVRLFLHQQFIFCTNLNFCHIVCQENKTEETANDCSCVSSHCFEM